MDIFLSWSGDRSRKIAEALRDWLPLVIDNAKPWFSGREIPSGGRWSVEVAKSLDKINFGILCLTEENVQAPWLLFEAGALAKAIEEGAVCPYLYELDISQITGPLDQFQARKAEQSSTLEMILDINKRSSDPSNESHLSKRFAAFWPELEAALNKIQREPRTPTIPDKIGAPIRSQSEILEELVARIRNMDRRFGSLEYDVAQLRDSATSASGLTTPRREAPRPSREIEVTVEVQLSHNTKFTRGKSFTFVVDSRDLIVYVVAHMADLNADDYMVDWHLVDSETGEQFVMGEYFRTDLPLEAPLRLILKD